VRPCLIARHCRFQELFYSSCKRRGCESMFPSRQILCPSVRRLSQQPAHILQYSSSSRTVLNSMVKLRSLNCRTDTLHFFQFLLNFLVSRTLKTKPHYDFFSRKNRFLSFVAVAHQLVPWIGLNWLDTPPLTRNFQYMRYVTLESICWRVDRSLRWCEWYILPFAIWWWV
jgi:hypothetical protein